MPGAGMSCFRQAIVYGWGSLGLDQINRFNCRRNLEEVVISKRVFLLRDAWSIGPSRGVPRLHAGLVAHGAL